MPTATASLTVAVVVQRAIPISDGLQLYLGVPGAGQTLFGLCGQRPAPACTTGNSYQAQIGKATAGVDIPYRIEYVFNANAINASVSVVHQGVVRAPDTITWTYA